MKYGRTITAIIALVILCGIPACTTIQKAETEVTQLNFKVLKNDALYGGGEEGITEGLVVASTMEEFNAIIQKMNAVNQHVPKDLISDVHVFDQKMLLFIFDKVRGSGGHELKTTQVYRTNKELVVEVMCLPPDGPATSVLTQPYEIIEINRSDLPVTLRFI